MKQVSITKILRPEKDEDTSWPDDAHRPSWLAGWGNPTR